ncbi:MAG: hypothetical protein VX845_02655 [Candidatus Thermoplasmatota archaeon]|nr:hypothetical protein [Candidatus Thermoplasmatota archaeon]
MRTLRMLVGLLFLGVLASYLLLAGELVEEAQWGTVGALGVLGLAWVRLGGTPRPQAVAQPAKAAVASASPEAVTETTSDEASETPAPVRAESPATMAERKRLKVQAAKAAQAEALAAQEAEAEEAHGPMIEVEVEEVHVAQEFVVEVTADSVEDADIAVTVEERRERHAAVRERIEARRRGRMAEIRAATVRMWEEAEAREDLVALLRTPDHGLHVYDLPEHPEPGRPYGATFVRLDEARVVKLRVPLDEGFSSSATNEPEPLPELPPLPAPGELPPLGDLPPLPDPIEARSDALAALAPSDD